MSAGFGPNPALMSRQRASGRASGRGAGRGAGIVRRAPGVVESMRDDAVMTSVWWVRRDARLADNPALLSAQEDGPAAAVFAWTRGVHLWSGRRRAHLARVLWSLREDT
ncbi:deoxyribodipyrimidine photo-lyase, partial [Demequina sp.]|uniref:deoxyribodipyrimidine photo-lyase n=1 Tax=Demequina sp. TaxID=2050685 RepID=UPI0034585F25